MSVINMLRKIFDPRYTDKKVDSINKKSVKKIEDATKAAKQHIDLHRRDGIAYRIVIAIGGEARHD